MAESADVVPNVSLEDMYAQMDNFRALTPRDSADLAAAPGTQQQAGICVSDALQTSEGEDEFPEEQWPEASDQHTWSHGTDHRWESEQNWHQREASSGTDRQDSKITESTSMNFPRPVFEHLGHVVCDGKASFKDIEYCEDMNPDSFTVDFWVRCSQIEGSLQLPLTSWFLQLPSSDDWQQCGYMFCVTTVNSWSFSIANGIDSCSIAGCEVVVGSWVRLTGSYDKTLGMQRFYVNGDLQGEERPLRFAPNRCRPLRLGAGTSEFGEAQSFFGGEVRDIKIFNQATIPWARCSSVELPRASPESQSWEREAGDPWQDEDPWKAEALNRGSSISTKSQDTLVQHGKGQGATWPPRNHKPASHDSWNSHDNNWQRSGAQWSSSGDGGHSSVPGDTWSRNSSSWSSAALPSRVEWKIDPQDGRECSFEDLWQKYGRRYNSAEIEAYWRDSCRSVAAGNATEGVCLIPNKASSGASKPHSKEPPVRIPNLKTLKEEPPEKPPEKVWKVKNGTASSTTPTEDAKSALQDSAEDVNREHIDFAAKEIMSALRPICEMHSSGDAANAPENPDEDVDPLETPRVIGEEEKTENDESFASSGPNALSTTWSTTAQNSGAHVGQCQPNTPRSDEDEAADTVDDLCCDKASLDGLIKPCVHGHPPVYESRDLRTFDLSQYVDVPYSEAINPTTFTIDLFVRSLGGRSYRSPLTSRMHQPGERPQGFWIQATPANRWTFVLGTSTDRSTIIGAEIEIGSWVRLTGTYDAATRTQKFYIDGKLQGVRYTDFLPNRESPLRIGAGASEVPQPRYFFYGEIAEIRIFDKVATLWDGQEDETTQDSEQWQGATETFDPWQLRGSSGSWRESSSGKGRKGKQRWSDDCWSELGSQVGSEWSQWDDDKASVAGSEISHASFSSTYWKTQNGKGKGKTLWQAPQFSDVKGKQGALGNGKGGIAPQRGPSSFRQSNHEYPRTEWTANDWEERGWKSDNDYSGSNGKQSNVESDHWSSRSQWDTRGHPASVPEEREERTEPGHSEGNPWSEDRDESESAVRGSTANDFGKWEYTDKGSTANDFGERGWAERSFDEPAKASRDPKVSKAAGKNREPKMRKGPPILPEDEPVFEWLQKCEFSGENSHDTKYSAAHNPPSFTVDIWVRCTGGKGYRSPLTSRHDDPHEGFALYATPDHKWAFEIGTGLTGPRQGRSIIVACHAKRAMWVHLTGCYDSDTRVQSFYVDGDLQGKRKTSFSPNSRGPLRLGAGASEAWPPKFFFPGEIHSVRIYKVALKAFPGTTGHGVGEGCIDSVNDSQGSNFQPPRSLSSSGNEHLSRGINNADDSQGAKLQPLHSLRSSGNEHLSNLLDGDGGSQKCQQEEGLQWPAGQWPMQGPMVSWPEGMVNSGMAPWMWTQQGYAVHPQMVVHAPGQEFSWQVALQAPEFIPGAQPPQGETNLIVSGLGPTVDDARLNSHFSRVGQVLSTCVYPDKRMGVVRMATIQQVQAALALHGSSIEGQIIAVSLPYGQTCQAGIPPPTEAPGITEMDGPPSHSPQISETESFQLRQRKHTKSEKEKEEEEEDAKAPQAEKTSFWNCCCKRRRLRVAQKGTPLPSPETDAPSTVPPLTHSHPTSSTDRLTDISCPTAAHHSEGPAQSTQQQSSSAPPEASATFTDQHLARSAPDETLTQSAMPCRTNFVPEEELASATQSHCPSSAQEDTAGLRVTTESPERTSEAVSATGNAANPLVQFTEITQEVAKQQESQVMFRFQ